jgi:hypothetical protein
MSFPLKVFRPGKDGHDHELRSPVAFMRTLAVSIIAWFNPSQLLARYEDTKS